MHPRVPATVLLRVHHSCCCCCCCRCSCCWVGSVCSQPGGHWWHGKMGGRRAVYFRTITLPFLSAAAGLVPAAWRCVCSSGCSARASWFQATIVQVLLWGRAQCTTHRRMGSVSCLNPACPHFCCVGGRCAAASWHCGEGEGGVGGFVFQCYLVWQARVMCWQQGYCAGSVVWV